MSRPQCRHLRIHCQIKMQRSVCEVDVNGALSVTEACKKIIKVLLLAMFF